MVSEKKFFGLLGFVCNQRCCFAFIKIQCEFNGYLRCPESWNSSPPPWRVPRSLSLSLVDEFVHLSPSFPISICTYKSVLFTANKRGKPKIKLFSDFPSHSFALPEDWIIQDIAVGSSNLCTFLLAVVSESKAKFPSFIKISLLEFKEFKGFITTVECNVGVPIVV